MIIHLPKIDLISFWFGFALATVLWLVLFRLSRLLPKLKQNAAENRRRQELLKNINREHNIRLFTLRKAQIKHLASSLFPLDKVLIEPSVIVSPDCFLGNPEDNQELVFLTILPNTPETPELSADFPAPLISMEVLANTYPFVCISGNPGTGKSTALAALASSMAKNEAKDLPIWVEARDFLNLEISAVEMLMEFMSTNVKGISAKTLEEIIQQSVKSAKMVLFIDSLDELDRTGFDQVVERIKELQGSLPGIKVITTSGTFYSGKLQEMGFVQFALSPWSKSQRSSFITKWVIAFLDAMKSNSDFEAQKMRISRTHYWLLQDESYANPFDLTLKVWLSLSNAILSSQSSKLYEAYLSLISDHSVSPYGYNAISEFQSKPDSENFTKEILATILNSRSDYLIRNESRSVNLKNIADLLVNNGLFIEYPDATLRFSNVVIPGYLKSQSASDTSLPSLQESISSAQHFSFAAQKASNFSEMSPFASFLDQNDLPLFRNYLIGMKWLSFTNPGEVLRTEIFKRSARLLQDPNIPFGLRSQFLYSLAITQDSSILSLLTILKDNRDPVVRQLAALGFGMYSDEKAISGLTVLSDDEIASVQNSAVIALGKIWSIPAQDALVNVIFTADEPVRANACEILSMHQPDGHSMLKEIMATDNYLARKAAIAGLCRINEPWVHDVLEKASVEDTQWVVRDAAIFALENLGEEKLLVPQKWLPVHENPWTLEQAEEYKMELSSKVFPDQLLYTIIEKGQESDKKVALHYLAEQPTPDLVQLLNMITRQENNNLRDYAMNLLFGLSKRGLDIAWH